MTTTATPPVEIAVVSDVVCPWCFIGKRQLESALQQWRAGSPDAPEPTQRWYPFQLNPDMPAQGMSRADYLLRKFGSANGGGMYARVQAAARGVGLELQLERIVRQPNTLKAHALIALAAPAQDRMVETLFDAYFLQARDLSDDNTLRELGLAAGLDAAAVERVLGDDTAAPEVARIDQSLREQGVSGVPLFVIGRAGQPGRSISGAQGAAALQAAIEAAYATT